MKIKKQLYICHSSLEYNAAMKLREEMGIGAKRIHKELSKQGISATVRAIEGWIYYGKEPFNLKILTQIPDFSKKLTKEKAYILGTLCGDGYISTNYRIGLDVIDMDFAEYFKNCLQKVFRNSPSLFKRTTKKTNVCDNPKERYCVMLVSKLAVKDLFSYSSSFKTFEWIVPSQIKQASKEIQAMFLKGFADSEGCFRNRKRNRELILCSGNEYGLKDIQVLMKDSFSIRSKFTKRPNGVCILSTSDYYSIKNFHDHIGFIINRKQKKLKAGLERYKRKGIRRYSKGFKTLALDMLENGYNYQEIGKLLNTSYANVHDWEKVSKNPNYYNERFKIAQEV